MKRRTFILSTIAAVSLPQWANAASKTYAIAERPKELTSAEPPDDEAAKEELGEDGIIVNGRLLPKADFGDILKLAKSWRPGDTLLVFRDQINKMAPRRKKDSDGIIGDAAHASRKSDHNPWIIEAGIGIVTAIDITHDKAGGCNVDAIVEKLRSSKDSRIKYVIWNKRIFNSQEVKGTPAWEWRPYSGRNDHSHHMHLSVKSNKESYDSGEPWPIA